MPHQRRASFTVVVAALTATLAAGCGSRSADSSNGDVTTLFEHRAEQVARSWVDDGLLTRWRTSIIAAGGLTVEPSWAPRPNFKASFGNGWVRTARALPTRPGSGTVTWGDGRTITVRALDAQATYDAMVPDRFGPCPTPDGRSTGCDWVTVTGAKAVTTTLATARGPAKVPAWAFTVEGLRQPLVRVAVQATEASDLVPAGLPATPRDGRRILLSAQGVVSHTATSLTFMVGSGACDTGLGEHVFETDDMVVVGGTAQAPRAGTLCNASLLLEPVTVPLRTELGYRPVVDAVSGRPLLSSVTPLRAAPRG